MSYLFNIDKKINIFNWKSTLIIKIDYEISKIVLESVQRKNTLFC